MNNWPTPIWILIGEDDLDYIQIVDDADAAAAILLDYYRRECPERPAQ